MSIARLSEIIGGRKERFVMVHGHLIAVVWCHDTGGCHATCNYRGVVPVVAHEERYLLKSCMCPSRDCKYQNELRQIPMVPVYIVREERPQDTNEGEQQPTTPQGTPAWEASMQSDRPASVA